MDLYNFDFSKKLLYQPQLIMGLLNNERPFPVTLEFNLTNLCNHKCSFCVCADSRNNSLIPTQTVLDCVRDAKKMGTKAIVLTGGGEPMLHPDFDDILVFIKNEGLDCGLITNGSLITEKNAGLLNENLTWIRISMAGTNAKSYESVQGVDHFERVLKGINILQKDKTSRNLQMNIGLRIIIHEYNIPHLVEFCHIVKEYNFNYIQMAHDSFNIDSSRKLEEKYKLVFEESRQILESRGKMLLTDGYTRHQGNEDLSYIKKCYSHHCITTVTAESNITFCKNAHSVPKYYLGNIKENSILNIWENEKTLRLEEELCPSTCGMFCRNMGSLKTLHDICNPNVNMSINFIS